MLHTLDYHLLITLPPGIFLFGLVLAVHLKRYRSEPALSLAMIAFFLGCWDISTAFIFAATNFAYQDIWISLTNIAAAGVITAFLQFVMLFPRLGSTPIFNLKKAWPWLAWFLINLTVVLPYFGVSFISNYYSFDFRFYPLYLYDLILIIFIVRSFGNKISHLTGKSREQVKFIIFAASLFLIGISTFNIILPAAGILQLQWIGPITANLMIAILAYAVLTHKLLDIRIVFRRILIYIILLLFILAVYNTEVFIFLSLPFFHTNNLLSLIGNFMGALLIGFCFEPLRLYLENSTGNLFFKKERAQQDLLKDLSKRLNTVIALDESLELIMQTVVRIMQLGRAATFVFQAGENGKMVVKRIKQIGYSSPHDLFLNEKDFIVEYFSKQPAILFIEDLKAGIESSQHGNLSSLEIRENAIKGTVLRKLKLLNVAVAIPLQVNQQLIGLILLSDKKSGQPYYPQDLDLLENLASQVTSSIEKAKLYEGDQMKSEFVSIASHELLTPISAIEGYLSLILDENRGMVDEQVHGYLEKVYSSAKRLSVLIKDLLSVSSIESGRLKIEPQSLDMNKMITDAVDQLRFVAQNKHIELNYKAPKTFLPPVIADPDRTMQVLINLLSNAIKYTPSGTVTIKASVSQQGFPHLVIEVVDTGLGMSKQAQAHLFEKFYRVATPETAGIIGTGLGLYITKSIVERMGGSISLKSTPGVGSTFSFTLPLFKVESSAMSPN